MKKTTLFLLLFLSLPIPVYSECPIPEKQLNLFERLYRNAKDTVRELRLPDEILQDRKDSLLIKDWEARSDYWQRKSETYLTANLAKGVEVNNIHEALDEERQDRADETRSLYEDMVNYASKGADMVYNQMLFIAGFILLGLIGFGMYIYLKKGFKIV